MPTGSGRSKVRDGRGTVTDPVRRQHFATSPRSSLICPPSSSLKRKFFQLECHLRDDKPPVRPCRSAAAQLSSHIQVVICTDGRCPTWLQVSGTDVRRRH